MSHSSRYLWIAAAAGASILGVQVLAGTAIYYALPDWPTRGQFGDVFGSVNAAFSGLAFAGLIYAILLQREDLELQRRELELTREELKRSAAAQEQSEIALRAQAESARTSARLSATNFLLGEYKRELSSMREEAFRSNDPRLQRMQELEQRIQVLTEVLDSVYSDIAGEKNAAQRI